MTHTVNGVIHHEIPLDELYRDYDEPIGLPLMKVKEEAPNARRTYTVLTSDQVNEAIRLYTEDGVSIYKLTIEFECCDKALINRFRKRGITVNRPYKRITSVDVDEMVKLRQQGLIYAEIASEMGIAPTIVSRNITKRKEGKI